METSQDRYDIYEMILKNLEDAINYIKSKESDLSSESIVLHLREFVFLNMSLKWETVCVIIDNDIEHDYKDPLRILFIKETYDETCNSDRLH